MKKPIRTVTRPKPNKAAELQLIQQTAQTRLLKERRKRSLLKPMAVSDAVSQKKVDDKALAVYDFVHVLTGKEPFLT